MISSQFHWRLWRLIGLSSNIPFGFNAFFSISLFWFGCFFLKNETCTHKHSHNEIRLIRTQFCNLYTFTCIWLDMLMMLPLLLLKQIMTMIDRLSGAFDQIITILAYNQESCRSECQKSHSFSGQCDKLPMLLNIACSHVCSVQCDIFNGS